jgi:hypothetical protein
MIGRSIRNLFTAGLAAAIIAAPHRATAAEDSIAAARDLYAAAAYEDALATLNRLGSAGPRATEARVIDQYRALCLLALGRTGEAEHAIEAVVTTDPTYHPSDSDVSPRVRAAFSDVRQRMLPIVAQQKYADAKAAFDRKQYAQAADGFGKALELFADPDLAAAAARPPLSDLRTLSAGFRDLSLQAMAPPSPPPVPAVPAPQPAAVPPAPKPVVVAHIYGPGDTDVVAPIAIHQELPSFRGTLSRPMQGVLEVLIDESGMVVEVMMRVAVNSSYDKMAVTAAASWRYRPATLNGVPVKYRKTILLNLTPAP